MSYRQKPSHFFYVIHMFYSLSAHCEICGLAKCCVLSHLVLIPPEISVIVCDLTIILYPLNLLANGSVRQPQMDFNLITHLFAVVGRTPDWTRWIELL